LRYIKAYGKKYLAAFLNRWDSFPFHVESTWKNEFSKSRCSKIIWGPKWEEGTTDQITCKM
jgi:hypothetical protein